MPTKDQAREQLQAVISLYEAMPVAERRRLNEASVRTDFIEPMFEALGWDTRDSAEVDKEVRVGETWADYAFRVDGVTRFYLEAKKPSADIENEQFARQAVSYAWAKGVSWAVLTNFETLKLFVVDADRQNINDLRVLDLHYDQYMERFDEDLWPLAKQNVRDTGLRQAFEHRGGAVQKQTSVDERLFELFKAWREELLTMFQQYNLDQGLTLGQIDEAVQRLLDRLIFIRTVEDRRIEDPILAPIVRRRIADNITRKPTGDDAWTSLKLVFRKLDGIYDSNLFEGHLLDVLEGEESVLLPILEELYNLPKTALRFNFAAIEADVLGRVYEQYLGHVAQTIKTEVKIGDEMRIPGLEPANKQLVELVKKHGKRKQQGIYYTPKYIVDYIVEQTLGRLLDERGGDRDFVESIRVLDPACGSGSFLIGAYDRLLAHYADVQQLDGPEHLSQDDRVAILQRHIYGVDLDAQAVEIARLNLVMRALKEQDELPLLDDNIVQGNSLISGDAETLEGYFGQNWRDKHPLNWEARFPEIMVRGGFDVVIGNPPYIRMEDFKELKSFLKKHFKTYAERGDIYYYFVERSRNLLRKDGCIGLILSNSFTRSDAGVVLRRFLGEQLALNTVVEFGDFTPFSDATVYPAIIIACLSEEQNPKLDFVLQDFDPVGLSPMLLFPVKYQLDQNLLNENEWVFESPVSIQLRERLLNDYPNLEKAYGSVCRGIVTGLNKAFIIDESTYDYLVKHDKHALEILKPYLAGRDLDRYHYQWQKHWMIYTPHGIDIDRYPSVKDYLGKFKEGLESRATEQEWYELQQPQAAYLDLIESPKIIYPDISRWPKFNLDVSGQFFFSNTVYFIPSASKYLLGLLNSKLIWFVIRGLSNALRGGLWRFRLFSGNIERLPIKVINTSDQSETKKHDTVVEYVDRLLQIYSSLPTMPQTSERKELENEIADTEHKLDQLVYELYGLTEEETAIVEAAIQ